MLAPGAAVAQTDVPCASLRGDTLDRYNGLIDASEERYGAGDYAGAIDSIMELKRICDEDPRLDFNLARAYQRDNNCNMARFWFEVLLERVEDDDAALVEERPQLATEAVTELKAQCSASARFAFDLTQRDAEVTVVNTSGGDALVFTYPFEGRIDAGEYRVTTRAPGKESVSQLVRFESNQNHLVSVPELLDSEVAPTVRVRCPRGIESARLRPADSPPDAADTIDVECEERVELAAGRWVARFELDGFVFDEEFDARRNREVDLVATAPAAPSQDLTSGDVGWILFGTGAALAVGGATVFGLAELFELEVLVPAETDPMTGRVTRVERSTEDVDDRALAMRIGGGTVGGIGAVLAITGIILVATDDSGETDTGTLSLVPRTNGASLGYRVRF